MYKCKICSKEFETHCILGGHVISNHFKDKHGSIKNKIENEKRYLLNPKVCVNCNSIIPYKDVIKQNRRKFCSKSCSVTCSNKNRKIYYKCRYCNKQVNNKFCNTTCAKLYDTKNRLENNIKVGSAALKTYLIATRGYICENCGIKDWQNKSIILELEHKDGNSDNNTLKNTCLLCPNCHSQTPTYKSKNLGNGRHYRRERYKLGKSY